MGEWKLSYEIIENYLKASEILTHCNQILYCVSGDITEAKKHIKHSNIIYVSDDITKYEHPTINFLKADSDHKNSKVLYLHTKGASSGINEPIFDWINVMSHFNIFEFKKCLELLDHYDAVGVDYHEVPFKHFSGNFWWSKSSHIEKLNFLNPNDERHAAEKWICSYPGNFKSLHNTNINVYERHIHKYPKTLYS